VDRGAADRPAWLTFALHYTGRAEWLSPRRRALVWSLAILAIGLVWTDDLHHLMWPQMSVDLDGPLPTLDMSFGPAHWANVVFAYTTIMLATGVLTRELWSTRRLYRQQAVALVISAAAPMAGNVLYNLRVGPYPHLDLTPFAFTIMGLGLAWSLLRYKFMDLVPIAHQVVFAGMRDAVIVLDGRQRIIELNPAAERVLGRPANQLVGQLTSDVFAARRELVEAYSQVIEAEAEIQLGSGAAARDYELCISPLRDRRGDIKGRVLVLRDITRRKRAEAALAHQALHDALTGLPNRTLLHDRLEQEVRAAERSGQPLALLLLDLDRFKAVNDSLGHHIGDALLQQVARRLRAALRASDTVARLGGDEFAVLAPGTQAAGAEQCAWACLQALSEPFEVAGHELRIGGAVWPAHGRDAATLLRKADAAMYVAKRGGRGYRPAGEARDQSRQLRRAARAVQSRASVIE
jgi:diguanylate cyclase (GGDEF)-like protein/PAS domain S-box-containing protein